jgi:chemotaxis protein MotB
VSKGAPIIIIKKKKHGHHGHHGGAWKVAYADFVTAMMAFFLVMWIVGQSAAVKAAVAMYFRDPGAFENARNGGVLPGAEMGVTAGEQGASVDTADALTTLERAAEDLRHALEEMPEFASLKDRIQIELTPEGLRIELLEGANDGFFEVGSSGLKPEGIKLLVVIATQLGKLKNQVAIEGHTDSRPYVSTDAFSNWELSTDRANMARRVMQQGGLGQHQLEGVRGYADTRLRFPQQPLDARNRRISIVVRRPGAAEETPLASAQGKPAEAAPASVSESPAPKELGHHPD